MGTLTTMCFQWYQLMYSRIFSELGGSEAPLEVEEAIPGIVDVLAKLTHEDSGAFLRYDGTQLPW